MNIILHLLSKFIKGKTQIIEEKYRESPEIIHYYKEIVRFWSKLNFIIKKTLRSLEGSTPPNMELLLFATYRFTFEKAEIPIIIRETGQNERLGQFLQRLKAFSWRIALKDKNELETLSISEAIPTFFIERLLPVMNFDFIKKNVKLMNHYSSEKSISLSVNQFASKGTLESLINLIKADFKKQGIKIRRDKEIPLLIHTQAKYKRAIITSKWYKNYTLIFQDKASAQITNLLKPSEGSFICDLCAAPGIKSSLIRQLSENKSKVLCNDFNYSRLRFTKEFLSNMKIPGMFFLISDGTKFPSDLNPKFDKVLIDAPCTGSGTFASHPELKWRQNYEFLNQNMLIQKKLIESGINLLKSGGILVYSTCSLYPEEGEHQINHIYSQMEPVDLPNYFSPSYEINMKSLKGTGRLFPSNHNTQGFFVSRLKKK